MTTRSKQNKVVELVYAAFFAAVVTAVFFLPLWMTLLFLGGLLTTSNLRQRLRY